jgi:hypothetical protein
LLSAARGAIGPATGPSSDTREIPTWAPQSAWWSDTPDSGYFAGGRPKLPQAKGPWDHYLLDAYGIPDQTNKDRLPVATNPYRHQSLYRIGDSSGRDRLQQLPHAGGMADRQPGRNGELPESRLPGFARRTQPAKRLLSEAAALRFQWIIPDRALALK